MRFATEVIDLMAAFPGRLFRMQQLVRYATGGATLTQQDTKAARKALARVLDQLRETGNVEVIHAAAKGGFAQYRWRHATSQPFGFVDSLDQSGPKMSANSTGEAQGPLRDSHVVGWRGSRVVNVVPADSVDSTSSVP